MKQFVVAIVCASMVSCGVSYQYQQELVQKDEVHMEVSVNSFGEYDFKDKKIFIASGDESISSKDLEFKEYAKQVALAFKARGSYEVDNRESADVILLVTYKIVDESYRESVPIPVFGNTGILSITTTTNSTGSATGYGNFSGNFNTSQARASGTSVAKTDVTQSYGTVGYRYEERKVELFKRALNIYAYDSKVSSDPEMYWKANVYSQGYMSDLRKIVPYLAFASIDFIGKSSENTNIRAFGQEDGNFLLWKEQHPNGWAIHSYPSYNTTYANPKFFTIRRVTISPEKTSIAITVKGGVEPFVLPKKLFLKYGDVTLEMISVEGAPVGSLIMVEPESSLQFEFTFPAIPIGVDKVDIFGQGMSNWYWYQLNLAH